MHVSADEQIWVSIFELVEACVVANRSTSDVEVDDLWTKFEDLIDGEFFYLLALAQLNVLEILHDLGNCGDRKLRNVRTVQLQCVAIGKTRLDGLLSGSIDSRGCDLTANIIFNTVRSRYIKRLQVPAIAQRFEETTIK